MSLITFLHPLLLIGLIIIPIIVYIYFLFWKKNHAKAVKFSSLSFVKNAMGEKKYELRKHLSLYIYITIIALMIVGFADPHIPLKQTKEGVNVVLAIDTSGSMQAQDYKPNRLEAAKRSAKILLQSLHENDNAGIIIFESGATTSAYISPFKDKVISKLEGIGPRQGATAIGDGLALAVDMASSIPNKKKLIILLSDGVNNAGVISPQEAIAYAKQNKIQVYSIGLGSTGKTVLGYDWFGNPQYADLDETTLKSIAVETKGQYFKSVDDNTLDNIYKTISEEIDREKEPTSIKNWFFLTALLLLILLMYIQYGKYKVIQ